MTSIEHIMLNCPVKKETKKIQDLGKEMIRSMGRLRRAMKQCESCEMIEHCSFREQFNQIVDQVVDEITEA